MFKNAYSPMEYTLKGADIEPSYQTQQRHSAVTASDIAKNSSLADCYSSDLLLRFLCYVRCYCHLIFIACIFYHLVVDRQSCPTLATARSGSECRVWLQANLVSFLLTGEDIQHSPPPYRDRSAGSGFILTLYHSC